MKKPKIHFFRFGLIESRSGWIDGYCEVTQTGYLVPPRGKRASQTDAKSRGGSAVFYESEHIARQQLTNGEKT
jgi:hypothetical protein